MRLEITYKLDSLIFYVGLEIYLNNPPHRPKITRHMTSLLATNCLLTLLLHHEPPLKHRTLGDFGQKSPRVDLPHCGSHWEPLTSLRNQYTMPLSHVNMFHCRTTCHALIESPNFKNHTILPYLEHAIELHYSTHTWSIKPSIEVIIIHMFSITEPSTLILVIGPIGP